MRRRPARLTRPAAALLALCLAVGPAGPVFAQIRATAAAARGQAVSAPIPPVLYRPMGPTLSDSPGLKQALPWIAPPQVRAYDAAKITIAPASVEAADIRPIEAGKSLEVLGIKLAEPEAGKTLARFYEGGNLRGEIPIAAAADFAPRGSSLSPFPKTASEPAFELPAPREPKAAVRNVVAGILSAALLWPGSSAFHELGHYLAARMAGRPAEMRIQKTLVTDNDSLSFPKQIAVSAAGPAFNFILAGGLAAANLLAVTDPTLSAVFWVYAGINVYLGAVNLIPLGSSRTGAAKLLGEKGDTDGYHIREAWRAWREQAGRGAKGISIEELSATDKRGEVPAESYEDLDDRIDKIAGASRDVELIRERTAAVIALEKKYAALSAEELRVVAESLRKRHRRGESLDELLPDAFAAMREAFARVLGKRPYVEQVAAGVGIHLGRILEQGTGEGKTMSIGLAAYLNALAGPVDVYTFNPYLALRDASEVGRVMKYMNLKVGALQGRDEAYLFADRAGGRRDDYEGTMIRVSRADAYKDADVLYGFSRAFVFDWLHDRDADWAARWTMEGREKRFAVVDEADAELLEEANTDFRIVSRERAPGAVDYKYLYALTGTWKEGEDFVVDEKTREVRLTRRSREHLRALRKIDGQLESWKHLELYARNALKARHVLKLDRDYAVLKEDAVILDPHTGRLQWGRYWESGLHRFVEIKEGLSPQNDYSLSSHITLDRFMKLYGKISGITGTVGRAHGEFQRVYGLDALRIPRHRPSIREDLPDRLFPTLEAKRKALLEDALAERAAGRPVLIGAKDMAESALLGSMLDALGESYALLNGAQKENEKDIVEAAGKKGALTVATQLAGRGTDIKPGKAELEAGGLHVILTEKSSSLRVDLQYRGRAARQGRPGSSRQYVSLEDDLVTRYATDTELASLKDALKNAGEKGLKAGKRIAGILDGIQNRASDSEAAGRDELRDKDALLDPLRSAYFALRASVFARKRLNGLLKEFGVGPWAVRGVEPFSRRRALSDLHEGWTRFVAEYEDMWLDKGGALTPEEARGAFADFVIKPFLKGRTPWRRLGGSFELSGRALRRFFSDTWYAKAPAWLSRKLTKPLRAKWQALWGKLASKLKRHKAAVKRWEKAAALRPEDAQIRFDLGNARFNAEDYDGAVAAYIGVLNLLWDDNIGYAYPHQRLIEIAIRNLSAAFFNRGDERARAGDSLGAVANLRVASEMNPTHANREIWEKIKAKLGEDELALAETTFPFMKHVYLYQARSAVDESRWRLADRYYTRVIELDPGLATARFGRAYARKQLKDETGTVEDLYEALRLKIVRSRQFSNMRLTYSKIAAASLDITSLYAALAAFGTKGAESRGRTGEASRSDRDAAWWAWFKGRALLDSKRYSEAAGYFSYAVDKNPRMRQAYDDRAVAYFNMGRYVPAFADFADSLKHEILDSEGKMDRIIAGHRTNFAWTPDAGAFEAFIDGLKAMAK